MWWLIESEFSIHAQLRPRLCFNHQKKVVISGPDGVILWWDVDASSPDVRVERLWLDHLTHVLRKMENPFFSKYPWMRHWLLCEWRRGRTEKTKKEGLYVFLSWEYSRKKEVRLHQHVHLRHKLKLCHVLNRCSATQRILCLWHGCTDRMKHAESGIQV